jgi:hypothetical protein
MPQVAGLQLGSFSEVASFNRANNHHNRKQGR